MTAIRKVIFLFAIALHTVSERHPVIKIGGAIVKARYQASEFFLNNSTKCLTLLAFW